MTLAAIYCRLSFDRDGSSAATERQEADCRALCEARGWAVAEVFTDNDVSAYSGRRRPAFERLLASLADGSIGVVVVWKSDRLARRGRDLQRFLDAAEPHGVTLTSCTEPEFTGPSGLLLLRILLGFAEHESSVKSERVTRANRATAQTGAYRTGGSRTFGYTMAGDIQPEEAAHYREAVTRVLGGEAVNAIVGDWAHRGITTTTGARWETGNLRRTLQVPRMAGVNTYQGAVIGTGTWEPLVELERWELLQAVLAARAPVQHHRVGKHLLTGLARCALCGSPMGGAQRGAWVEYRSACGHVVMRANALEAVVVGRFFVVVGALLGVGDTPAPEVDVTTQLAALHEIEAQLVELAHAYLVERIISKPAYLAVKVELDGKLAKAREAVALDVPLAPIDARAVAAEWEHASTPWRRSQLERLIVAVDVRKGRGDRATVLWR